MGTFHDNKGELHGITVVASVNDTVYVGRCHEWDDQQLLLLDADQHTEGQEGRSNGQYLERAAKFGVWKKHDRLQLPAREVEAVTPLSEFYQGIGKPMGQATPSIPKATEPVSPLPAVANDDPVLLTDSAREEVRRLLTAGDTPGPGLRLGVSGGGCSGLVYKVEFDSRKDEDVVVPQEGFEVFLDPKSVIYLRGVVLDFQSGLSGRGFQFSNPNASNTCGCGESFAV
jgi:iron-sulfur cluster assembly protein